MSITMATRRGPGSGGPVRPSARTPGRTPARTAAQAVFLAASRSGTRNLDMTAALVTVAILGVVATLAGSGAATARLAIGVLLLVSSVLIERLSRSLQAGSPLRVDALDVRPN